MMYPSSARPMATLALGLGTVLLITQVASALPAVQSVVVDPSALTPGAGFTITVEATDVTQAVATMDFRPWATSVVRVPLSLQAGRWIGSSFVPANLAPAAGAEAIVKVTVFNASRARADGTVKVAIGATPAVFNPGTGVLTVVGNGLDNTLAVSADGTGRILVNGGAVPIVGGIPTLSNTTRVRILGLDGADQLVNDLPGIPGELQGGPGNDTLRGGSGPDDLFGGLGNDTLEGRQGADRMFGGGDDDVLVWRPGDGSDLVEGQNGSDILRFNASNASEIIDLSPNGSRLRLFRNIGNITLDTAGIERVEINALGGADNLTVNDLAGTDVTQVALDLASPAGTASGDAQPDAIVVNGTQAADVATLSQTSGAIVLQGFSARVSIAGADGVVDRLVVRGLGGDDTLDASGVALGAIDYTAEGGLGDDVLIGTQGRDLLLGGDGDDVMFGGGGDDTFVWSPGDDNDTLEGQAGTDTMLFNGANVAENIDLAANGGRLRFFRNVASVVMDANDVEHVVYKALGGADAITINDLSGTDVTRVDLDLAGIGGGGDGLPDSVIVTGSNGDDTVAIATTSDGVTVIGLAATVNIANTEGGVDALTVLGQGGGDSLSASGLPGNRIRLALDGGNGNDVLTGSRGQDLMFGGANDDTFIWNPGDGSDVLEGQAGSDTLRFFGSNASENIDLAANGVRLRFFRDVANITMDAGGVENVEFLALGGTDTVTVGDLSGTGVSSVLADLSGPGSPGAGDGQPDTVVANGTPGDDVATVTQNAGSIAVQGFASKVSIRNPDGIADRLIVRGLGGADILDASSVAFGAIDYTAEGGLGDDVLLGSQGNDLLLGGDGDDLMLGGGGDDSFVWNPGDDNDTLEGQDGFDTMRFNGANVAETIDISANGGRLLFFRNIASVVMDANDVERVEYQALGGADVITVNDLTGTDVTQVSLDLAIPVGSGTGDAAADSIAVRGTSGDDVVVVTGTPGSLNVFGLAAQVSLTGFEAVRDVLAIQVFEGDDVIEASGVVGNTANLILEGGSQDDILIGGDGADILLGGEGDDVLLGGPGIDVLDGGPGDDVEIQ